ncbi:hypothetical protein AB7X09_20775, partial [Providencia rettgeri]
DYHQTNQKTNTGKTLKPWPILVDHYTLLSKEKGLTMTNTQLLLLATNNIRNNVDLSHSQESYVYQFYYANVVGHFDSIQNFLTVFKQQTSAILDASQQLAEQRQQIYSTVEYYLEIAEKRYIERKKILGN